MSAGFAWREGMVGVQLDGGIAQLILDRPNKLNAMDRGFWPALINALAWARAQEAVRCLIFRGAGERAFSVGGDVASFVALATQAERRAFQVDAMAAFEAVATCPLPTMAAVRGYALGGGCELAMACDFVVAAEDAVFALPEAHFGLVPGYGVLRAPVQVGASLAKLMILSGERLSAADALRHGLVQRTCPPERLDEEVQKIAAAIAAAPPAAIAAAKMLIDSATDPALVSRSIDTVTALHGTEESRRATRQFVKGEG